MRLGPFGVTCEATSGGKKRCDEELMVSLRVQFFSKGPVGSEGWSLPFWDFFEIHIKYQEGP